ncbi:MAG: hypothetical protein ACYCSI_11125 [Solirubrobacteraceae bacterium]
MGLSPVKSRALLRRLVRGGLLCLLLALVGATLAASRAQAAETSYVDGISDQSLAEWYPSFGSFFKETWVKGGHIRYARFVLQWDAEGSPEWQTFTEWLYDVRNLELTPDVSITTWEKTFPATIAEYRAKLAKILLTAHEYSDSGEVILEPWNEPNGQGKLGKSNEKNNIEQKGAQTAAEYADAAHEVCTTITTCTLVAGNFEDDPETVAYVEDYRSYLRNRPKTLWGRIW